MLVKDKQEFVASEPKKAPIGGDTAPLEAPQHEFTLKNIDWASSEVLDMLKFSSVSEAIKTTQDLARKGAPDAKRALKQMERSALSKPLDMTFKGKIVDAIKTELPISDFDDSTTRQAKEKRNAYLRENRTAWVQTRGD